jgi:hypothetical protein
VNTSKDVELPGAAGNEEALRLLLLADWRRRVSELYAEVRELAALDPKSAWDHWRRTRLKLYREHPSSPVKPGEREAFAEKHFDWDPGLRFECRVVAGNGEVESPKKAKPEGLAALAGLGGLGGGPLALPVSTGEAVKFERVGWIELPLPAGVRRLALFWLPEYSGGFFLPFRDTTNGAETYGGGRYLLDTAKGADLGGDPERGTVVIDLNFAYHPSCAFDPIWSCPLSPLENRLDVPVAAGERLR